MRVDDYLLLPETGPRYQLVNGELHMAPAPNTYHQVISRNLCYLLMDFLEESAAGELFAAPFDVYLSETDVLQPDICVFTRDQQDCLDSRGAIKAPALVVEILSRSSHRLDRGVKRETFARCGTRELWLIDPDRRECAVYSLAIDAEEPGRVLREEDILTTDLLPGLKVSLARVFGR